MIFVTVGHQTPFDRLIHAVDMWAAANPSISIFGQIGDGSYEPEAFPFSRWLSSEDFGTRIAASTAIVSHAGTGTILQVLMADKPLLVLPRQAAQNETRNDHQIGTARYFSEAGLILSIEDETEIAGGISHLLSWRPSTTISANASPQLINRLTSYIQLQSPGKTRP